MSPDRKMAQQSLKEERDAVRAYNKRIRRAKDPRLVRALKHAQREERQHAASFKRLAPSLGIPCSRSPRIVRGIGGALLGGLAGGVLGVLIGGVVGARKLQSAGGNTWDPVSYAFMTAIGVAGLGVVAGTVGGALPPEC